jgi:hypothetical protein
VSRGALEPPHRAARRLERPLGGEHEVDERAPLVAVQALGERREAFGGEGAHAGEPVTAEVGHAVGLGLLVLVALDPLHEPRPVEAIEHPAARLA